MWTLAAQRSESALIEDSHEVSQGADLTRWT
jgi:hypothetical protein